MKNVRTRKLVAMLALSVPVFLAARGLALDVGARFGDADRGAAASVARVDGAAPVPAHLSGSVIDLWVVWALRNALAPASVQVATAANTSTNKAQQESQP